MVAVAQENRKKEKKAFGLPGRSRYLRKETVEVCISSYLVTIGHPFEKKPFETTQVQAPYITMNYFKRGGRMTMFNRKRNQTRTVNFKTQVVKSTRKDPVHGDPLK